MARGEEFIALSDAALRAVRSLRSLPADAPRNLLAEVLGRSVSVSGAA